MGKLNTSAVANILTNTKRDSEQDKAIGVEDIKINPGEDKLVNEESNLSKDGRSNQVEDKKQNQNKINRKKRKNAAKTYSIGVERKTERLNLLVSKKLKDALEKRVEISNETMNGFVNYLLEKALFEESENQE